MTLHYSTIYCNLVNHFSCSARLSLPWPEEKRVVTTSGTKREDVNPNVLNNKTNFALLQAINHMEENQWLDANHQPAAITTARNCEPIIEEPASPEPECTQISEDIEDAFSEDPDGIPTIKLNVEQFTQNLHNHVEESLHLQGGDLSKALVAIAAGATSIPVPMLKNVRRLRTEHEVSVGIALLSECSRYRFINFVHTCNNQEKTRKQWE